MKYNTTCCRSALYNGTKYHIVSSKTKNEYLGTQTSTKYIHYFVHNGNTVGTVKDAVFLSIMPWDVKSEVPWHQACILRLVT